MTSGDVRVDETPWILEVNGRSFARGTYTRDRPEALGVGRLLGTGAIRAPAELHEIHVTDIAPGCTLIRARIDADRAWLLEQEQRHRAEFGCGLLHGITCDVSALRRDRLLAVPPLDRFPAMLRALFAVTAERHPGGGMHAAALTDGEQLLVQAEDVGRHNAVDKALGAGFLRGLDLARVGLIISSRVSGQIAASAARAGVAWLASRSIATSLAMANARAGALPTVERAAHAQAHVEAMHGEGGR